MKIADAIWKALDYKWRERERERERESPNGCSLVGKVAQWKLGGHGFNPYIP